MVTIETVPVRLVLTFWVAYQLSTVPTWWVWENIICVLTFRTGLVRWTITKQTAGMATLTGFVFGVIVLPIFATGYACGLILWTWFEDVECSRSAWSTSREIILKTVTVWCGAVLTNVLTYNTWIEGLSFWAKEWTCLIITQWLVISTLNALFVFKWQGALRAKWMTVIELLF